MKNQHEQTSPLSPEEPCKDLNTFFFFFKMQKVPVPFYTKKCFTWMILREESVHLDSVTVFLRQRGDFN